MVKPYLINYISVWIASSLVTLFVFQGGPALPWFHRLSGFRDDGLDALGRGILDVTGLKGNVPSTATELSDSAYRRPELLARLSSCQIQDDPDHPLTRKYGRRNLDLMVPFKGSRDRLGWFMRKLKSGHPVKVVVVGGSITHGHGVLVPGATYGERIFDWIKENYLNEKHSYVNGAVPGASVTYFSFCFGEHVPIDADLVIAEFDVNSDRYEHSLEAFEDLFRELLNLPGSPAVIYASAFALLFPMEIAGGSPSSVPPAMYYDVPIVSARSALLPHIMKHPEYMKELFYQGRNPVAQHRMDPKHMNELGHELISDAVIALFQEQDCQTARSDLASDLWSAEHDVRWPKADSRWTMPRLRLTDQWSPDKIYPNLSPKCYSVLSATSPLEPVANTGFTIVDINDKKSWMAEEADKEIAFKFSSVAGKLGLHIWGTNDKSYGACHCWIDDTVGSARIVSAYTSWFAYSIVQWTGVLWDDIEPGEHTVTCRTGRPEWGGTKFRIIGLSSM